MNTLIRGQKVELSKANKVVTRLKVGLGWDSGKNNDSVDLDAVALLIDQAGSLSSMKNVVFYNNKSVHGGAVQLTKDNRTGIGTGDDEEILINLNSIPTSITKIVLAINIYHGNVKNQSFSKVLNPYARIIDSQNGQELYRYDLEKDFASETTVIVGEIYQYKNTWKFSAVGRGVESGLSELCALYHLKTDPTQLEKVPVINKEPTKPTSSRPPSNINLSKIELKKSGDKINLNKTNAPLGEILVNLNWNQNNDSNNKGLFSSVFSTSKSVDLDLGCLFELEDGYKGVIQALGKSFGQINREPYIHLDKDDRTGASKGGENLRVNGNYLKKFKRILVFAFIYEGAAKWSEVDGVVTLKQQNGPDIVVRLDDHRNGKGMCAIALLENVNNETLSVKKVAQYYNGHRELDKAFNWGMRWKAGSK